MSRPMPSDSMAAAILSDVLCSIVAPLIRFAAIGCSMYEVDGIDLTRSQYLELCDLVDLPSDEERVEFSKKALQSCDDETLWNQNGLWVYKELEKLGLIVGTPAMNAFLFDGEVTQRGIDWVADFRAKEKEDKRKIWSDRRFQILLSLITLVLSTIAGWFAGQLP